MTVDKTQVENQMSDPFAYLYPHQFALLKTYRKNGAAVPTPIWFANENGKLYVTTSTTTGKMKRIHNNGRVTLVPCDRSGKVTEGAKEVEGIARELSASEYAHANAALLRKYKLMYRLLDVLGFFTRRKSTYIEIAPAI